MRHASLFGFLSLLYFASTENVSNSSPETVQPQQTSPTEKPLELVATKLTVSPTWYLSVGDTAEINCTAIAYIGNHGHGVTLQLLWTTIGPGNTTKTVLQSRKVTTGINYILGPVTHEHQGIYTCDDDGSKPHVSVARWHRLIWVADASPRVTLDVVSHNRSQFLDTETFTLSCQLPDANTNWKMMRFNTWLGTIIECPNQETSNSRLSCTSRPEYPWTYVLYWCESPTGERSNAINITTSGGMNVILESPPLPVLEGEDVTLRCLHRNRITNTLDSNFRTYFYKNNRRIRILPQGILTLTAVTKASEGVYTCGHPVDGVSIQTWLTVKEEQPGAPSTT